MDTSSLGAEALEKLKATFAPERWAKIERQAAHRCGLDAEGLQGLCAELLTTSAMRWPAHKPEAALYSAANRLLLEVGSVLKPEDIERFEAALQAPSSKLQAPSSAPQAPSPKPKRGGKHDPAPVSQ
jgi:hypothetical protein